MPEIKPPLPTFRKLISSTASFDLINSPTNATRAASRLMRARCQIAKLIELLEYRFNNRDSVDMRDIIHCHKRIVKLLEHDPLVVSDGDPRS